MRKLKEKPKFTVCCDFFQCMMSGKMPVDAGDRVTFYGENIIMQRIKRASRMFERCYEITVKGKPFAVAFTHPRQGNILAPDTIQLKVNNERLYTDWVADMVYLCQFADWRVNNVSRVDIALDGYGHLDFYERYMSGEIEKVGRARTVEYYEGKRELTGVDVGRKKSDKYITIYNKSKELEQSHKGYIREYWERSGLELSEDKPVERLELKLKNAEIKRYKYWNEDADEFEPFNWERLNDPEYMASLLRTGLHKLYEFVRPGETNITRAERVEYIEWEQIGGRHLLKTEVQKPADVARLRQTCKTLYWMGLQTESEKYWNECRKIATAINSLKWLVDREPYWRREFVKRSHDLQFKALPQIKGDEKKAALSLQDIAIGGVSVDHRTKCVFLPASYEKDRPSHYELCVRVANRNGYTMQLCID